MKKSHLILEYVKFINEKPKTTVTRKVPNSLLWSFLTKINNIGIQFQLNLALIKGYGNSLNTDDYMFIVKTNIVDNNIFYLFEENPIFNPIVNFLHEQENVRFYIAINSDNQIEFGVMSLEETLTIGYCEYSNYDFTKISKHIEYHQNFNLEVILEKIKEKISTLFSIKNALMNYYHLDKSKSIYSTIINDKFTVILESTNNNNINKYYLEKIIREYSNITSYNWYLSENRVSEKTFYYIYIK